MKHIYAKLAELGHRLGAEKVVLYGSRARGDHRERSDVDVAVFGLAPGQRNAFTESVEELPTLLDFDIVFVSAATSPALLENIEKDGIVLMNKAEEKLNKLGDAVARLQESIEEYNSSNLKSDVVRDGVIQRFEFCTELAWKATREYLLDQGYTEINSPKSVMKRAYADGIISDEAAWISLLNDRNRTSHIYDEATASEIFQQIQETYVTLFIDLKEKLSQ